MKFIQIFIPVAILHLVVIAVILLQPGCQARPTPPPPAGASAVPGTGTTGGSYDYVRTTPSQPDMPPVNRQQPMRPVDSNGGGVNSNLPSAFNGNLDLDESSGPLLMPVPEEDPYASSYGEPSLTATEMDPYAVVPGDTLSAIARRYGVTVDALRNANGLTSDTIRVGDTLMIPTGGSTGGSGGLSPVPTGRDSAGQVYEVIPGDNLSVIARRHGVSVAELKAANGLTSDTIRVGQKLYVPTENVTYTPPPPVSTGPVATNDGTTYVVAAGDTPITIARRLGVSYQSLMEANGITDPRKMRVGQVLIVPGQTTTTRTTTRPTTTTPTPAPRTTPPPTTTTPTLRSEPTRPTIINNGMDPADLERELGDDLPVSELEVVEPSGNGG